jgi:hypothetical protein
MTVAEKFKNKKNFPLGKYSPENFFPILKIGTGMSKILIQQNIQKNGKYHVCLGQTDSKNLFFPF